MTTREALPSFDPASIDPAALIRSRPAVSGPLGSTQGSTWWRGMEWSITTLTVLLVTFPVMNSITEAGWVADTPDLRLVGFLALLAAALLAASPLPWSLGALLGLPVGALVVFWQVLTTQSVQGQPFFFDRFEDLWFRLKTGSRKRSTPESRRTICRSCCSWWWRRGCWSSPGRSR